MGWWYNPCMRSSVKRALASFALGVLLLAPLSVSAANVFGGQVGAFIPCVFNASLWASVGAPRGGWYIETPFTKLYPKGPLAPGKYVLGLYGIPYFCIYWVAPLGVWPGITITMMGSS